MRGRDAAKELTLKVNISKVLPNAFSETKSIVNHNSQSDGQNKSAKRWTNWQNKITRTISLQRNSKDTKDNESDVWVGMTIVRYQSHCLVSKNDAVIIVIEDDCHATMFSVQKCTGEVCARSSRQM